MVFFSNIVSCYSPLQNALSKKIVSCYKVLPCLKLNKKDNQLSNYEKLSLILTIITLGLSQVFSIDWNQYHGRRSDNKTDELITSAAWLEKNSAQKWKADTPLGFSSFSCEGSKAFTLIAEEDEDGLVKSVLLLIPEQENACGAPGFVEWITRVAVATQVHRTIAGRRSKVWHPSVFNGKVWVYDSDMILYCINAENGKILWDVNVIKEHAGINIKWKNSSAPLIEGDLVIVYGGGAGQSLLAFNRENGELIWKTGNEIATHATPIATTIHGVRQIIFFCNSGLVSAAPHWNRIMEARIPFKVSTAASPVVAGDLVYCSAGYGVGAGLYKISKNGIRFSSTEVWRKKNDMFNHWSTPIYHDGHLYGMFSLKRETVLYVLNYPQEG